MTYCKNCGCQINEPAKFCQECGKPLDKKINKWIAIVLLLLFGYLGLHKFYLGSNKTGFLFLTGGIIAIFVYLLNLQTLTLIHSLILMCELLVDLVLLLIKERI